MIFGIKEKSIIFDPYSVFLAIASNIPQRLKTGFVVQGHKLVKLFPPFLLVFVFKHANIVLFILFSVLVLVI